MTKDQQIISDVYRQVENLEDFVKISAIDFKISQREAEEILRLLREIKDTTLK